MSSPLVGVTVLVPRAREQASRLVGRIRDLGGEPLEAPTIEILPGDREALAAAVRTVADGAHVAVCFTSPNGVRAVAEALEATGLNPSVLDAPLVAAVGPGTTRTLREVLGREPDLVPETSTTQALGAAVPPGSGSVLLPRADIATPTLPDLLREKGYEPVLVAAYRTALPAGFPSEVLERLVAGGVDLVAFTSSSTVRNFVELVDGHTWAARVVSIGPVTSATCREHGIEVTIEAEQHDLDGLVAALMRAVEA